MFMAPGDEDEAGRQPLFAMTQANRTEIRTEILIRCFLMIVTFHHRGRRSTQRFYGFSFMLSVSSVVKFPYLCSNLELSCYVCQCFSGEFQDFGQIIDYSIKALRHCLFICFHDYLRINWRFVRVGDARKIFDLSDQSFSVKTFDIPVSQSTD